MPFLPLAGFFEWFASFEEAFEICKDLTHSGLSSPRYCR